MSQYIALFLSLYILSYLFYIKVSHGLGHKAQYLQLRRFLPCGVLAVLPLFLTGQPLNNPLFLTSLFIGVTWIITYPLFYFLTYKKNSSDFGFHLDTVFGLYITSWLFSFKMLLIYFDILPVFSLATLSIAEFLLLTLPVTQWGYYYLYKTCINDEGLTLILQTDRNETIEFYKSLPIVLQIFFPIVALTSLTGLLYVNLNFVVPKPMPASYLGVLAAIFLFLTIYLWNPKKGVFIRTGIIELYLDVKQYLLQTAAYKTNLQQRLAKLTVTSNKHGSVQPRTIIMVIGESESRDYMSAFDYQEKDSTPWLKKMKKSRNYILFPNAYACKDQTVPALERALTEVNQYNDKKFYAACSVIDIAKKAGYKTYWFSNQGHIGSAETAITLVANTADKAEWTKQDLNRFQYDETLLEYLKQVNPQENNFIVLHLMGNHFNFINRYPQSFAKFSQPDKYDLIPNYLDSIAYTDHVLQQLTEYAQKELSLQALVYFSDHATIPDKRRSPNFGGFATVRIPLFIYLADDYIKENPTVYNSLLSNKEKYFTNDLIYELMCGIFNITSSHFDETNSLASEKYKYTVNDLKTDLGRLNIKDDIK